MNKLDTEPAKSEIDWDKRKEYIYIYIYIYQKVKKQPARNKKNEKRKFLNKEMGKKRDQIARYRIC